MCDVGKCRRPAEIKYAAFGDKSNRCVDICWYHWEKHCEDEDKFDLKVHFYPTLKKDVSKNG